MIRLLQKTFSKHLGLSTGFALLCTVLLTILFPSVASAHAILLSSNPAQDAVLHTAPTQVQMWFSEALNPGLSTVQVMNGAQRRVDNRDVHVNSLDDKEMDATLQANLQPDVYVVLWRTDSADDGYVLLGSFTFTIARADGTIPQATASSTAGNAYAGDGGTLNAPSIFNLLAVTLVELGAIFWVGAQLWCNFVLSTSEETSDEARNVNQRTERRFERRFSVPTLILLLVANLGVLYGQSLVLTSGDWVSAFSPSLLIGQITGGRFGTYWIARMVVILLALVLGLFMAFRSNRPLWLNQTLPLINLFLGAMLFIAITMSGHAAAVNAVFVPYSVIVDWVHLLASALWVGGMIYILLIYLPVLKPLPVEKRVSSLLTVLPLYSPLAIAGVVLMAITGPLSTTFHLTSIDEFFMTAYGRTLLIKILLVGVLLMTSTYHVFWLRPRLKKEFRKYSYAKGQLAKAQKSEVEEEGTHQGEVLSSDEVLSGDRERRDKQIRHQVKLREERITKKENLLTSVLSWEPWVGVAVIVCVGLMNVFAGTLTSAVSTPVQTQQQPGTTAAQPFNGTIKTTDGKYSVTLNVSPNRFGTNVFTVNVTAVGASKQLGPDKVGVTIYTTMLDMNMGTDSVNLQSNGKGGFSASGDLGMGGHWGVRVQVRTLDNQLHEANFTFQTPF